MSPAASAAEDDGGDGDMPPGPDDPGDAPGTRAGRLLLWQPFTAVTVLALHHALTARLAVARLTGDAAFDFVVAVHDPGHRCGTRRQWSRPGSN